MSSRTRAVVTTGGVIVACVAVLLLLVLRRTPEPRDTEGDLERRLEQLRSVPYTTVTEDEVAEDGSGVIVYEAERAYPGYNLFTPGIVPQAFLIDMSGEIVHAWTRLDEAEGLWHHVMMLPGGDLIVINEFQHVMKLDWDSNVIWKTEMLAHHDAVQLRDGSFYVIGLEKWDYRGLVVRFPTIEHLTAGGEIIEKWSARTNLDQMKEILDTRSFIDTLLDSMLAHMSWLEVYSKISGREEAEVLDDERVEYDAFHMNTINLLPHTPAEADPRFKEGNILICLRNVNQVAVLDGTTKQMLWAWGEGVLEWPHHPTMLENGNILIFDNGARRKWSRVIELDPVTEKIEWQYVADPPNGFYSYGKGSAQRLPNGNTLICEGDRGRAVEVTPEGEIVWEWLNPKFKGKRRVQVYRMERLEPEAVSDLLRPG